MKLKVQHKLCAALRSGHYRQTRSVLRTSDGRFCLLGVLCDVVAPELWSPPDNSGVIWSEEQADVPGPIVRKRAGVTLSVCNELGQLNDAGHDFDWLAAYIEMNF